MNMKLTIELVPTSCLMQNVHPQVPNASWKRLCLKVFHYQAAYRCGICGTTRKTLHCHEQWEYHDQARTRTLIGFLALCPLCYYGKHIEEARLMAKRGELDMQHVEEHFCRVNCCTHQEMEMHERAARRVRKQRNRQKKWKSDYGEYAYLLTHASEPKKPANTPVGSHRKKSFAFSKGAEKRKEALQKKSSSLHKQNRKPERSASFKKPASEQGSWQEENLFVTAFQKGAQR